LRNKLTAREKQIVALMEKGYPNKTIARELSLSPGTIKVYLSRIYSKLDIGRDQDSRLVLALWRPLQRIAELEFLLGQCGQGRSAELKTLKLALRRAEELEALFKNGIAALDERAAIDAAREKP